MTGMSSWAGSPRGNARYSLMAEGHSNAGVASRLVVTEKAVSKHIGSIFTKLDCIPPRMPTVVSSRC